MEIHSSNQVESQVSQDALKIRKAVFIDEQGIAPELEYDTVTSATIVYVGYVAGKPVTTARMVSEQQLMHVQRVATLKAARKHGYAKVLLERMARDAKQAGYQGMTLGAQLTALGFYETMGYQASGPEFLDADIRHRHMQLLF